MFPSSLCVKLHPPGVHIQVQPHECMPACAVNELTETGWCSSIVCLFFVLLGHTQSVNVVVLCSVCTAQTEVPKKLQIKPYKWLFWQSLQNRCLVNPHSVGQPNDMIWLGLSANIKLAWFRSIAAKLATCYLLSQTNWIHFDRRLPAS